MHPIFSVLICHLYNRQKYLRRLLSCLYRQKEALDNPGELEILVSADCGEGPSGVTTGAKRNALLARCHGDFAAFIDDDDMVVETYVQDVLTAIKKDPSVDAIGMKGIMWGDGSGKRMVVFVHSIACNAYDFDGTKYRRTPNHLSPVATRVSKKVLYNDITKDEDRQWCLAVKPYLKRETMIQHPIYHYLCGQYRDKGIPTDEESEAFIARAPYI